MERTAYLKAFCETRRMKRDAAVLKKHARDTLKDPVREAVGLPIGTEGEYFVGGKGSYGQGDDESILDHNHPPSTQPGLWCKWTPTDGGTGIEWSGAEKFYDYVEWLQYIIGILELWGHTLNGTVYWQGEEIGDVGKIVVKNNVVTTKKLDVEDAEPTPESTDAQVIMHGTDKLEKHALCTFCNVPDRFVFVAPGDKARICEDCANLIGEVLSNVDEDEDD